MQKITTDYGLVYNTDGSLCTTYRDDDIPFPGVRSFAVEEATENLFGIDAWEFDADQSTFYPGNLASGKTWEDCWDANQRAYVGGEGITAWMIYTKLLDLGQVYSAGTKITLSWKHKGYFWHIRFFYGLTTDSLTTFNSTNTYEIKGDASFDYWEAGIYLHLKINGVRTRYDGSPQSLLDRWYDIEITYTLPTDARYVKVEWNFYEAYQADSGRGVKGYIHKPQIEVKPFATSFVAGSRPGGRILFEDMQEIEYDNFVFTCWANYRSVAPSWQFLTTIFTPDNSSSEANHYSIRRRGDGLVYLQIISADLGSATLGRIALTEGWHFFLIAVHDGCTDFWIDDAKYTSSIYVVNSKDKNIYLGTAWFDGCYWQNTIANVFVGKYKKPNGEIIWTDEYIQEMQNTKLPYVAKSKPLVI